MSTWQPDDVTIEVRVRIGDRWGEPARIDIPRDRLVAHTEQVPTYGAPDVIIERMLMRRALQELLYSAGRQPLSDRAKAAAELLVP